MKTHRDFNLDASSPSSEAILQLIRDSLYDLNVPGEALYVLLYQALADEHQRAIDMSEREMADALRRVMVNVHLILSLNAPDDIPVQPDTGSPQTIRALMHRRDPQG